MIILRQLTSVVSILLLLVSFGTSQEFDFEQIKKGAREYNVILNLEIEISLGTQTNSAKQEVMGTVVSSDGLIMFDGSLLDFDHSFSVVSGSMFKATPTKVTVHTMADQEYKAEYLGVDSYTKLGFVKLTDPVPGDIKPIKFKTGYQAKTGEYLSVLSLLPKHVSPRLSASIGMVSAVLAEPEPFTVTYGFRQGQMGQVLYNLDHQPVGVLGVMDDFGENGDSQGSMFDPFGEASAPIVGIVTGEKINDLIANPPVAGSTKRAWLGITLQALTEDIAEFLGIDTAGGIIVNNVVKGSPASNAGLEVGDVIYRVNGQPVRVDSEEKVPVFQRMISEMEPGSTVDLSVYRPGENGPESLPLIATLEAAPMPASEAPEYECKPLEFSVRDLVFADYLFYNMDEESLFGVVVTEMESGGPAMLGGLAIGDIIQKIDGKAVNSVDEAQAALESIELDRPDEVILFVFRDSKTLFVNIKTGL